jgi:hypothetical protein
MRPFVHLRNGTSKDPVAPTTVTDPINNWNMILSALELGRPLLFFCYTHHARRREAEAGDSVTTGRGIAAGVLCTPRGGDTPASASTQYQYSLRICQPASHCSAWSFSRVRATHEGEGECEAFSACHLAKKGQQNESIVCDERGRVGLKGSRTPSITPAPHRVCCCCRWGTWRRRAPSVRRGLRGGRGSSRPPPRASCGSSSTKQ